MSWLERWHGAHVHRRRVQVLASTAARMLPPDASVLDIGCGDGLLAATLQQLRTDLTVCGVEVLPRPDCRITCTAFDGRRLPFGDGSFDTTLLIDVLHHTDNPAILLREAARVARHSILLKDHLREGLAAQATLQFMDKIGNRRYGVALPFNYLNRGEWETLFEQCSLVPDASDSLGHLYPFPANLVFGRDLHFLTRLVSRQNNAET